MSNTGVRINRRTAARAAVFGFITFIALCINLKLAEGDTGAPGYWILNLAGSFKRFDVFHLFLFPVLSVFYYYTDHLTGSAFIKGSRRFVYIPAFLFSFFMVFGYSFYSTNTWHLAVGLKDGQLIKGLFAGAGYFILFTHGIRLLYYFLDHVKKPVHAAEQKDDLFRKYIRAYREHPFLTAFLTLLILYIPYVILSYPAIFMGDTENQIVQFYPEAGIIVPDYLEGHLVSEDVFINTHHPVFHSFLIHLSIEAGRHVFGSANAGIFLYAFTQWLMTLAAVSYAIRLMIKELAFPAWTGLCVVLYAFLMPRIQSYMFLVTKDVFYAVSMIYVLIGIYYLLSPQKKAGTGLKIFLPFALAGFILFRNEGRYVLILTALVLIVLVRYIRRKTAFLLLSVILFTAAWTMLLNMMDVSNGSIREVLSVPFQQTARYVTYHEEEVTADEEKAISAVLDYAGLAELYNPNKSDAVKDTFNEDASREDLMRYFTVWGKMLLKHPTTYVQATMNNYYKYFYPADGMYLYSYELSERRMTAVNTDLAPLGIQFSHPSALASLRNAYEDLREAAAAFPPFRVMTVPALFVWAVILLLFYSLRNRCRPAIAFLVLPSVLILSTLLGPCNGNYMRYIFPVILSLPLIAAVVLRMNRGQEKAEKA